MAKTTSVLTRVNPDGKKQVEKVLISLLSLNKEQFDFEINKGIEDIKTGRVYSADTIEIEMKKRFWSMS